MARKLDVPSYTIDPEVLQPFDGRNSIFGRKSWDQDAPFYKRDHHDHTGDVVAEGKPGYSRVDAAQMIAARTVDRHFRGAFSREKLGRPSPHMERFGQHAVDDPAIMSEQVKQAARMYGAALVGICRLDRRWVFTHNRGGGEIEIPPECEHAIVIAIEMDPVAIGTSPSFVSAAATGVGYSRMAFTIACVAEFIRNLGYTAIPTGNGLALSIPLAIDAGLGELGRNGLLITPEYGACVRLCKVFTDLPLAPDPPITFGLANVCKGCSKCAEACEVDAISVEEEPSFDVACASNNPGILRWAVNHERCYTFWIENGAGCSTCIAACPFTGKS